ncbi:MAG TPA: nucleotidyltransferase, partial [Coriobacteriia bacterium]|nr:nucleotidyltransferase [Coriobacteriia bacterium]
MKEQDAFAAFLRDVVNLNQTRLDDLDTRVAAIVACLEADGTFGWRVEEHIPQGSWAHRTIIKPLPGDEFDADVLLVLTPEPDWATDPGEYLRQVRAALQRSTTYNGKAERKNRCVRVRYAGDCHVDVVPCIETGGQTQIVNYAEQKFELTNPDGFTAWMKARDDTARGNLRKVIRLLKYLRDFKNTFDVPSVILTTLAGERVTVMDAPARYADVPTALKTLLEDLDTHLRANPTMPDIEDPSCPGTSFSHRLEQPQYET